jgi:hypothetical protein
MKKLLHAMALVFTLSPVAVSQTPSLAKGDVFAGGYAASSFFTDRGPHFALLRNRKVVMVGYRRERVFRATPRFAFASTVDIPVSILLPKDNPPRAECWLRTTTGKRECYNVLQPGMPVGAVGITPLGIKTWFAPASPVRLFGSLAGGLVAFDRRTPVEQASAVNFAAEWLVGADFNVGAGNIEVAWKFQHWSNANTTHFNPGLDVNLITIGFKQRR